MKRSSMIYFVNHHTVHRFEVCPLISDKQTTWLHTNLR